MTYHPSSFQVSEFYLSVTRKYCFPTSFDQPIPCLWYVNLPGTLMCWCFSSAVFSVFIFIFLNKPWFLSSSTALCPPFRNSFGCETQSKISHGQYHSWCINVLSTYIYIYTSGWCSQTFSHKIWDNPSHWLIFFRGVKTTNQTWLRGSPACHSHQSVPKSSMFGGESRISELESYCLLCKCLNYVWIYTEREGHIWCTIYLHLYTWICIHISI